MSIKLPPLTITDELEKALDQFLDDNPGVARAYVLREGLKMFLEANGLVVEEAHPQMGGRRIDKKE